MQCKKYVYVASEGYSLFGRASARQNFEEKFDLKNLMVTSPSGLVRSGGGGSGDSHPGKILKFEFSGMKKSCILGWF